jgi:SAM-dependent methyltransferase
MNCRHCGNTLELSFADLGAAPPSNAYLAQAELLQPERYYPLQVSVCRDCWLVQTLDYASREELFSADYAYFSSYATTWLEHARRFVGEVVERFTLGSDSLVIELAANDGYLLQYVKARNIPCLGIEPTASTAHAAREKDLEIIEEFFGVDLASRLAAKGRLADLIVANNVLAHVPDINEFVAGVTLLLKPDGVASFEFPHLLKLVEHTQFDTIYHEHYSYLSLTAVDAIFRANGLAIFDVEELSTHGGSLRVLAMRRGGNRPVSSRVADLLAAERDAGVTSPAFYEGFQVGINRIKNDLLAFLIEAFRKNQTVVAYGAAAKGNTLLNYAGVKPDLLRYAIDRNVSKQGKFLPGSRIPIVSEERLRADRPDFVLILPWNLEEEITGQLDYIRSWGGRFVCAVPELRIK